MNDNSPFDLEAWLEDFVAGLVARAGLDLQVAELAIDEGQESLVLQLDGEDRGVAVGRDGQVLDALQTLVLAAAANQRLDTGGRRILVDVDHYRERRDERLRDEALRLAEEVRASGRPRDLEPMPPRERRLVHMAVAGFEGVRTESAGQGAERFVRLVPERAGA